MGTEIKIAIIGGGVVGCAIARALSRLYDDIFVFEKNPGITSGENQSSRNSGVIHSGIYYDQETRPQKAGLCVEGNQLLYEFCKRFKVPALNTGKLMVATTPKEEDVLDIYLQRATENLVPGVEKIPASKVHTLEPNVKAACALIVPTAGIVEPTSLVYRLHALASQKGVQFITGTKVIGFDKDGDFNRLTIQYRDNRVDHIKSRVVINAAGVEADRFALMVDPRSPYELDPVTGDSYKFYAHKKPETELMGMNVYPTPEFVTTPHSRHFTVGIHLTPTLGDLSYPPALDPTVLIGPRLVPVRHRDVKADQPTPARVFAEKISPFFPGIKAEDLIWHQTGMQARLKRYPDFIIKADSTHKNVLNLLGIDSPGLTSCLAIASRVSAIVEDLI